MRPKYKNNKPQTLERQKIKFLNIVNVRSLSVSEKRIKIKK